MAEHTEGPLAFEIHLPPVPTARAAEVSEDSERRADTTLAVLLHGRGSDETDLQGLARLLPPDWIVATPRAPHPGGPWGYGPGWAWYRYRAEDRVVHSTLTRSLEALDDLLSRLPARLGFHPQTTVMGGFSQGGTTSLAYALTRPQALSAALNFSGFLADSVDLSHARDAPAVFWGHGRHDPNIPFELALRGRERLTAAGARVLARDYDIGHGLVAEEVADAVEAVRSQ